MDFQGLSKKELAALKVEQEKNDMALKQMQKDSGIDEDFDYN